MKKIFLAISFAIATSLALSGCGQQEEQDNVQQQLPPVVDQQIQQTEEELDIDKEILNLDASMDDIKDTGFAESDLSDSDLGI